MNAPFPPVLVLADEHMHSARLMRRTLQAINAPARLLWLGHARRAEHALARMIEKGDRPQGVIVDLKAHSAATATFIAAIRDRMDAAGIAIIAFVPEGDRRAREAALAAGARAVFDRHHECTAYRRQIAELVEVSVHQSGAFPIRA